MLFIEIGNLSRRAVVSDFTILAFVKRRGKGRDHKSHCGHNKMPPGHLEERCRVISYMYETGVQEEGQSQR